MKCSRRLPRRRSCAATLTRRSLPASSRGALYNWSRWFRAVNSRLHSAPGEAAAIRLWFDADADLLLSDDGRAIRTCRILGLPFTSSPRVVVDLYRGGAIRLSRARRGLEMLAVAGRYSRDVIAAALVALQEEQEDDQTDNDPSP